MLPFLTYPLAMMGLAALPALAAIYLLHNRFRRRTVSSLMLWQLQERSKEGGVKMQRVKLPLIFFLELLILCLLVTSATGPRWRLGVDLRPLVVVLDDSASMQAVSNGKSARTRALEALDELLKETRFLNIRLVLAGAKPRLPGGPLRTTDEVNDNLAHWTCNAATSDMPRAIAFAREISRGDALLLVLSDRPALGQLGDAPRLQWWSFGEAPANLAFINAARSEAEDHDRCLLEIGNFSNVPRKSNLRITAGGKLIRQTTIEVGSNSTRRVVLNLPPNIPAIEASLDEDALAADNHLQLLPPLRKRIRVSVAVGDASLAATLNRTIDATGLRSSIKTAPQLVFHDNPGSPAGTDTWSVQIIANEDAKPLSGPFVVDTSHPAAVGLSLSGMIWAASEITNAPGYLPLITSGRQTLMAVRRDIIGRQRMLLNLTPDFSTVIQTPNWPILIWNVLSWRRSELPGLEEVNYRPGAEVRIRTQGDFLKLTYPDGKQEELTVGNGEIIARADAVGIYRAVAKDGEWKYAVNFFAADESDLQETSTGTWGKWENDTEARKQYSAILWLFLLLALLGIVGHHYMITHGRSRL